MSRLLAIGDIHGDYERFVELLIECNVISKDLNWIAGESTFVCIGDLVDRGPQSIPVIELCMDLEKQALDNGGYFTSLMGNHDALLIAASSSLVYGEKYYEAEEMSFYNGGVYEDALALANTPTMLDWMIRRPLIYKKNRILFQHADSANYYLSQGKTIEEINKKGYSLASGTTKEIYSIFYDMCDCRYWDERSFDSFDHLTQKRVDDYLKHFDCSTVVHGHTPFRNIKQMYYLNNKVINADAKLSIAYSNKKDRGLILEF
jgi:Icc-related predicted phosphoesterase